MDLLERIAALKAETDGVTVSENSTHFVLMVGEIFERIALPKVNAMSSTYRLPSWARDDFAQNAAEMLMKSLRRVDLSKDDRQIAKWVHTKVGYVIAECGRSSANIEKRAHQLTARTEEAVDRVQSSQGRQLSRSERRELAYQVRDTVPVLMARTDHWVDETLDRHYGYRGGMESSIDEMDPVAVNDPMLEALVFLPYEIRRASADVQKWWAEWVLNGCLGDPPKWVKDELLADEAGQRNLFSV